MERFAGQLTRRRGFEPARGPLEGGPDLDEPAGLEHRERRLADAASITPGFHPDVERFARRGLDGAPAVGLLKPHGLDRVGVDREGDPILMLVPGAGAEDPGVDRGPPGDETR